MKFAAKAALSVVVGLICVDQALAENCTCSTAYKGSSIGSVGQVNGEVLMSQAAGYGPAKSGDGLNIGSHVNVGKKASASVVIGGCNLTLPANSSLDISLADGKICVKVQEFQQSAGAVQPRSYVP
ncbi:hypothetical protein, partial [Mesorhizobium sp.]|uniref:hypothetical protein n=1 Tax=Mesorhizobium sp. TaxID=1871066 RepID=UPI0035647F76